jgi:hypothetical protein
VWPDAVAIDQFLRRVRRRLVMLRLFEGAASGVVLAASLSMAGAPLWVLLTVGLMAPVVRVALGDQWRFGWWRSLPAVARAAERRTSLGRNLLVTASELPRGGRSYVNDVVMQRAAQLSATVDPAELFPTMRVLASLVVASIALWLTRVSPSEGPLVFDRGAGRAAGTSLQRLRITVTPPAYSGASATTVTDPSRIDALASSRIEVRAEANASSVRMETLTGFVGLSRSDDGEFRGGFTATADGFIAIEPRDSAGAAGSRSLIGLAVTQDRPPRVSLTAPGRDLFFSTVPGSLPVAVAADDDIELSTLRLRYTAVSGSGERFTFVEREVPITLTRANNRSWTARGTWNLASLELAPGDLVVYRAVATDKRPGSTPVESESYVIEVVTPGAIAAEGFAADDQRDRYAVSQQMVILKTERLLARRASIPSDSVTEDARLLAAEQRSVRAEFVFMMGGELEDLAAEMAGTLELNEVAEAEAEGDLLAGRLQNQGRVDMTRAIRAMSRASAALTEANLEQALRDERAALDNLMRAFSRSRFILRALTQRERIDLERRLSGTLNLTAGLSGPSSESVPDERVTALRRLLSEVAALRGDSTGRSSRISDAAMALIRANPGSEAVRSLAARVQDLARAPRAAAVDSVVNAIAAMIQLPRSPNVSVSLQSDLLRGAWRAASGRGSRR